MVRALTHPVQSMPGSLGGCIAPAHQKEIGRARENDGPSAALPRKRGREKDRFVFLEVINERQDPLTHSERVDAVGKPAIVRLRPKAGMKIEVPYVAVKVGNGVLMDLGRRNDEDRVSKPHDPRVEEGEEVKEQGMGHKPILLHREADMQAVGRPRMAYLHGRLDLEAKVDPKVTPAMDVCIPP